MASWQQPPIMFLIFTPTVGFMKKARESGLESKRTEEKHISWVVLLARGEWLASAQEKVLVIFLLSFGLETTYRMI